VVVPVIGMDDEALREVSDAKEEALATKLPASGVEPQLVGDQIEAASARRFDPVPHVLQFVLFPILPHPLLLFLFYLPHHSPGHLRRFPILNRTRSGSSHIAPAQHEDSRND
jgi:hypothetical protein